MRSHFAWLKDERVRLAGLLAVLALLLVYVGTNWTSLFGGSDDPALADIANCPEAQAPSVTIIDRADLRDLREELRHVASFVPGIRPYEQGAVGSGSPWTDAEPGLHWSLPRGRRVEGSYEIRWWMPNRDDVVADGFVFATPGQAEKFFKLASSTDCRSASVARPTSIPPGGRDLEWSNPLNFAQEDVFLRRGRRVYWVSVVVSGAADSPTSDARRRAFSLVNGLACRLPDADCRGVRPSPATSQAKPPFYY